MEGQILGNRYQLLEKIGGGGMAHVYRAKCKLLNRFVAVKILRKDFSNDEEFIRRFRIEAQAAASLSHPNIVSIYDVGYEDDTHYIVMEYVDGINLKDYINRKGILDWKETVTIARQICSAIEQAHKNNIVHRDIKPHNILYTSDGVIKVTDFGIARAASFSSITMVGSTIGSVHYFSPEQARGGYTDEKSDLYSLGVVLFELVTGKIPFDGDTPVAIALKHIQNEPQEPITLNKNLPIGMNSIILNALKKDQALRYQTATEFLHDLNLVLKDPISDYSRNEPINNESTRKMPAISLDTIKAADRRKGSSTVNASNESNSKRGNRFDNEIENPVQKKRDRLTIILAVLSGVLIIPIIALLTMNFIVPQFFGNEAPLFKFQDYRGMYFEQIKKTLEDKGIDVQEIRRFDNNIPKNIIISQSRAEGDEVKLDRFKTSIVFDVSDGPQMLRIPDLRMLDYRNAEDKATQVGLVVQTIEEFSDSVAKGIVVRTEPIYNTEVQPGSTLKIFNSKGPEEKKTMVPYLIGKTREEALKLLVDAKLAVGKVIPENSTNNTDKITLQQPEANAQVMEGTPVNITFEITPTDSAKKLIRQTIVLSNPEKYSDKITVTVETLSEITGKSEIVLSEIKNKTDFPLTIAVPVTSNEKTKIRVYLNNSLHSEF